MRSIDDRGPARHFHGRKEVLANFMDELGRAKEGGGGTTFLIQGPPGVGKTALLEKCADKAKGKGWRAVQVTFDALHDPTVFMEAKGKPQKAKHEIKVGFGVSSFVHGSYQAQSVGKALRTLMRDAAEKKGLLLVLDEVQNMARYVKTIGPQRGVVELMLDQIHNGRMGAPVILLAGGLGHSQDMFDSLGISRFKDGCAVDLECLSPEFACAVIRDWLVKDGGAAEGPELDRWIDAISQETHGWAQHIIAFAQPAAELLQRTGRSLVDEGLTAVLTQGRKRKERYYKARVSKLEEDACKAIAALIQDFQDRNGLAKAEIISRLADRETLQPPEEIFSLAIQKGVFARTDAQRYTIPIPSMRDWMVETFP